jgi:hypothetical protein
MLLVVRSPSGGDPEISLRRLGASTVTGTHLRAHAPLSFLVFLQY